MIALQTRVKEHIHVQAKVPQQAIRDHHRQMLEKAIVAIEAQEVKERYLFGSTVTITEEQYEELAAMIDKFHNAAKQKSLVQGATAIYRLQSQLFKLA